MKNPRRLRRAITIPEIVIVVAVILVILAIAILVARRAKNNALLFYDGGQVREIHNVWLVYSREFKGLFPTPMMIANCAETRTTNIPCSWWWGPDLNNHANLYSACIMQSYMSPRLCVGTTEANDNVQVMDDYNWESYDPASEVFWDQRFNARLDSGSNVSFAQMPLSRERKVLHWRETMDSRWAMVGNRGPEGFANSAAMQDSIEQSATTGFHGDKTKWVGQICYSDNHVETQTSVWPDGLNYKCPGVVSAPDNIFNNDCGAGNTWGDGRDIYLCLVHELIPGQIDGLGVTWD